MKDFSFFLLKNSFGAKMKKGIRTFCNNGDSTSILDQNRIGDNPCLPPPSIASSPYIDNNINDNTKQSRSPPTLEEMILQLELEEEIARRAKLDACNNTNTHRRMSCVNNSDILRSARTALNQYPRFSLDGRDAMYRSSFRNLGAKIQPGRNSVCCDHDIRRRYSKFPGSHTMLEKKTSLPPVLAGESVVWCKPGVVAKLMGLDAIPVPLKSNKHGTESMSCAIKRKNLRRRAERQAMERRIAMNIRNYNEISSIRQGSSSRTGCCVMKPVAVEPVLGGRNWPT